MRLRDTPENRVTASILLHTSTRVDWQRNPTGRVQLPSGVWLRYGLGGILGTADWIGIVRATGTFFAREDKAPGQKPDMARLSKVIAAQEYCPDACRHALCHLVHQELYLRRVRDAAGIGIFADCVADVEAQLARDLARRPARMQLRGVL